MATAQLNGPRIAPQAGQTQALVVLCHGFGADGHDLIGLAPAWANLLPQTAFVAPHAPEPCAMAGAGYQWFAIDGLDPEELDAGVRRAAPLLDAFLDQELARLGLSGDRLALVGFSQGTMMALHVGLRRRIAPAAILGYSGALVGADSLARELQARPPVLLIHGDADPMIPVEAMFQAANGLAAGGVAVRWHVSPGVGHGIDPVGLELGGRFLAEALASPPRPSSGRVTEP